MRFLNAHCKPTFNYITKVSKDRIPVKPIHPVGFIICGRPYGHSTVQKGASDKAVSCLMTSQQFLAPESIEFCSRNKSIWCLKTLGALLNPLVIIHQWISRGSDM
jgi:hypothetical protein